MEKLMLLAFFIFFVSQATVPVAGTVIYTDADVVVNLNYSLIPSNLHSTLENTSMAIEVLYLDALSNQILKTFCPTQLPEVNGKVEVTYLDSLTNEIAKPMSEPDFILRNYIQNIDGKLEVMYLDSPDNQLNLYFKKSGTLFVTILPVGELHSGQEVVIRAKVEDLEGPVNDARVVGDLCGYSFELFDDGKMNHGDGIANDGIYSARVVLPHYSVCELSIFAKYNQYVGYASEELEINTSKPSFYHVTTDVLFGADPPLIDSPVKIIADVKLNGTPVTDANVYAILYLPDSTQKKLNLSYTGQHYETTFVPELPGKYSFDIIASKNSNIGYSTSDFEIYKGNLYVNLLSSTYTSGKPSQINIEVTDDQGNSIDTAAVTIFILSNNDSVVANYANGTYVGYYSFKTTGTQKIEINVAAPHYPPVSEEFTVSVVLSNEAKILKDELNFFVNDSKGLIAYLSGHASSLTQAGDYYAGKVPAEKVEFTMNAILTGGSIILSGVNLHSDYFKNVLGSSEGIWKIYYKDFSVSKFRLDLILSGIEMLSHDVMKRIVYDSFRNQTIPRIASIENSRDEIINYHLGNLPSDLETEYAEDLKMKISANKLFKDIAVKQTQYILDKYTWDISWEHAEQSCLWGFCSGVVDLAKIYNAALLTAIFPPAGTALSTMISSADLLSFYSNMNEDERILTDLLTISPVVIDLYSSRILTNVERTLEMIENKEQPITPQLKVSYLGTYSEGLNHYNLWWEDKKVYSLFSVENLMPDSDIAIIPYAIFIKDGRWIVITGDTKIVKRNSVEPLEIVYFNDDIHLQPPEGAQVNLYLVALTKTGYYLVYSDVILYSPSHIQLTTTSTKTSNVFKSADGTGSVPLLADTLPVRENNTMYTIYMNIKNNAPYPVLSTIESDSVFWKFAAAPKSSTELNFTINIEQNESISPEINISYFDYYYNKSLHTLKSVGKLNSNQPPRVNFSSTYSSSYEITFDASSSYDPDGYIVRYTWDFGDGYTEITTSPIITHTYSSAGTYIVTLTVTDNDGLTDTYSELIAVEEITMEPSITTSPQQITLTPGSTTTVEIILDQVPPTGLSYANLTVTMGNSSIAEITDIEFPSWASLTDYSELPASTAWFKVEDLSYLINAGDANVVLATLTIQALNEGSGQINIQVNSFQDDNYTQIKDQIATIPGTVTVIVGPPPIDGVQPNDTNEDGLFEDVNGDSSFNFGDVVFFFKNFDKPEVKDYPQFYDFNGDGSVNFGDVVALFKML